MESKLTQAQYQNRLKNIRGTFAAEGMSVSASTLRNLERIASGKASYQQVLEELRVKYQKRR